MTTTEIQKIIEFVTKNKNINEINIQQDKFSLTIKTIYGMGQVIQQIPVQQMQQNPQNEIIISDSTKSRDSEKEIKKEVNENHHIIKAQMIGTLYRKPEPNSKNYIEKGDVIKKGQVICIIEAMKLFNEILSEVSGKVIEVYVTDNQAVEFDQPLFLIEKTI